MKIDLEKRGQTLLLLSLFMHTIYPHEPWFKTYFGPFVLLIFLSVSIGFMVGCLSHARDTWKQS
jgi:hypothetical protein